VRLPEKFCCRKLKTQRQRESFKTSAKNYSGACNQHLSADPTPDGKAQAMCTPKAWRGTCAESGLAARWRAAWQCKAAGCSGSCLGTNFNNLFGHFVDRHARHDTTRHDTTRQGQH
jgi:hypothetical protein